MKCKTRATAKAMQAAQRDVIAMGIVKRAPPRRFGPTGKVVATSKNLAGLRRDVGKELVARVDARRLSGHEGAMYVHFCDGSVWATRWADFSVILISLREWRNLYGVPLYVDGRKRGVVEYSNPLLVKASR